MLLKDNEIINNMEFPAQCLFLNYLFTIIVEFIGKCLLENSLLAFLQKRFLSVSHFKVLERSCLFS